MSGLIKGLGQQDHSEIMILKRIVFLGKYFFSAGVSVKAGLLQPFFHNHKRYHLDFLFLVERPCEIRDFYTILASLRNFQGAGYKKTAKKHSLLGQVDWNFHSTQVKSFC